MRGFSGLAVVAAMGVVAPTGAQAQESTDQGLRIALSGEAGWRWVALGASRIPREDDTFSMAYHGALRLEIGGAAGGLYSYARFDGYAPTGLGTFPYGVQARLGWFTNVHYFDAGGARSSTSTHYTGSSCGARYCYDHYEERTTHWWEPAGWVNGLRYLYVGGRLMGGTEVEADSQETRLTGAVSLGAGMVETKFSTWFGEAELLYFPAADWREDDRSDWGFYLRGGTLLGPAFIDITLLLDPAVGGELSIGAGIWLGA